MAKHKLLVLISGSGTNLQAVIDACQDGKLNAEIVRVISNRKGVKGLERAERANIPTSYHNLVKYKKDDEKEHGSLSVDRARARYDGDLARLILSNEPRPDLVVCAGFMHILAPTFLDPMDAAGVKVINLHPALPDQYDGVDAIGRAYRDFQDGKTTHTGLMIHYVIAAVDKGQPIVIRKVELRKDEDQPTLEERFHKQEHVAIVDGTKLALEALPDFAPAATAGGF